MRLAHQHTTLHYSCSMPLNVLGEVRGQIAEVEPVAAVFTSAI